MLLVAVLVGCMTDARRPEHLPAALDDRNPFPIDIEAPPPGDTYDAVDLIDPATDRPYSLVGRVLDQAGRPLAGATVAVESENLREPVNNVATYLATVAATRTTTAADGSYRLSLEGGFYHLVARMPGYLPGRAEPELRDGETTRQDIVVARDHGPLVVAHRGASFYAPENTLAAFHKAFLLGAGAIEIDARLAADGSVILFHDLTLERTSSGTGAVSDHTLAQLRQLDAGGWFHASFGGERIPTLDEVLALAAHYGGRVVIDQKAPNGDPDALRRAVLKTVWDGGHQDRVTIATFRDEGIRFCRDWGHASCLLFTNPTTPAAALLERAQRVGADTVVVTQPAITKTVVADAERRGLELWAGTTNTNDAWKPLVDISVDGMLTDRPGYLVDYLIDRAWAAT